MLFELINNPINVLIMVVGLLLAITVHEAAHAYLADTFGDPTPRAAGRVTLNPLAHLDPLGTLALLLFRFGWGKPVPVNSRYFARPVSDEIQVALAGPLANLMTAVLLGVLIRLVALPELAMAFVTITVQINLVLMIFNLLPIPPLDGSRLLKLLVSAETYLTIERYGLVIVLFIFLFGGPFIGQLFDLTVIPLTQIIIGR